MIGAFQSAGAQLAALATLLLASHAASAAVSTCEAHAIRDDRSLLAGTLANWEPVDDQAVLIWAKRATRAYLVRLARPLDGLTTAAMITLIDGDDDRAISPCGHDAVTLGRGGEGEAVRIVSIELLSRERTAELDRAAHIPPLASSRI